MRTYQFTGSKTRRRGTAMVEFALIVIVFLSLLMGMIQFGVYLNAATGVVNLAREGARYAAVTPGIPAGNQATASPTSPLMTRLSSPQILPPQLRGDGFKVTPGKVEVRYLNDAGTDVPRERGVHVKVTVTYNMADKLFLPRFFSNFFLKPLYSSSSTFRVETS